MEGLGEFKEAFEAYSDNYVIIGGTACDITMTGTAVKPRATHDIDIDGKHVNTKDIKKHRSDVLKNAVLLEPFDNVAALTSIIACVKEFVASIRNGNL